MPAAGSVTAPAPAVVPNSDCLDCHEAPDKPAAPARGDIDRVAAILHATKRLQKPVPASEFERKKMLLYLAEISRWALALTKSLRGK